MNQQYVKNYKALETIEPSFEKWGIELDDKVISIPDYSINGTLYYMNRKGFTNFGSDLSKAEGIVGRIKNGAKFLIVNDSTILSQACLKPFLNSKVGDYQNVSVFDIQRSLEE